jgi:hypothetical protein
MKFCFKWRVKPNGLAHGSQRSDVEVLEKRWDWAKELHLKPEELRNVLCLSKYKSDQTAWNMAAGEGDVEVLEKPWDRAKKPQLKPEK